MMKQKDKAWYQALALACACIQRMHGESTIVVDLFNAVGLSKKILVDAEVEEYDIEAIREAFGDKWEELN